jgi:hypothetical protein
LVIFSSILLLVVVVLFLFKLTGFIIIVINEILKVVFVFTTDVFKRKGIAQCHPEVRLSVDAHQKPHQGKELLVILVLFERCYGDAVAQLLAKAVNGIVHEDYVLHLDILDYPQVLQVHVIFSLDAAFAVEPVLNQLARWVDVV